MVVVAVLRWGGRCAVGLCVLPRCWDGAVTGLRVSDPCSPLCPVQSLPLLYSPLNKVVGRMTFSKLIEVLQEMSRPLSESTELPVTMALKNQVRDPEGGQSLTWCPWGAATAGPDSWCFPAVWDLLALLPDEPW